MRKFRPTTSKTIKIIFDTCRFCIKGSSFLDMCAGSGSVGFKAISEGASSVTFIEKNKKLANEIRKKSKPISSKVQVFNCDARSISKRSNILVFDIIYADPPYGSIGQEIIQIIDSNQMLNINGILMVEDESKSNLHEMKTRNLTFHSTKKMGGTSIFKFTNNHSKNCYSSSEPSPLIPLLTNSPSL